MTGRQRELTDVSSSAEMTTAMVSSVERLSRLTSDLANERTLLAWMRTCLAAIRTVFAYVAIRGTNQPFEAIALISEMSMATLVVVTAVTGHLRYAQIKDTRLPLVLWRPSTELLLKWLYRFPF